MLRCDLELIEDLVGYHRLMKQLKQTRASKKIQTKARSRLAKNRVRRLRASNEETIVQNELLIAKHSPVQSPTKTGPKKATFVTEAEAAKQAAESRPTPAIGMRSSRETGGRERVKDK